MLQRETDLFWSWSRQTGKATNYNKQQSRSDLTEKDMDERTGREGRNAVLSGLTSK